MPAREISKVSFTLVYPLYVKKAERKNRTRDEVNEIIRWLTGYSRAQLARHAANEIDFEAFFDQAPALNPNCALITGVVCGVRVEGIADPVTRNVRYLDKLIDELAQGRSMDKILRAEATLTTTKRPTPRRAPRAARPTRYSR